MQVDLDNGGGSSVCVEERLMDSRCILKLEQAEVVNEFCVGQKEEARMTSRLCVIDDGLSSEKRHEVEDTDFGITRMYLK